ncbi:MAG: type III pantothenate kinase [Bacteroidia bacterium]
MNLAVDFGNTNVKCALFSNNEIVFHKIITENIEQELNDWSSKHSISQTILSSVVNTPSFMEEFLSKNNGFELTHHTKLPIVNKYTTPETLGKDRLANAVALAALYPNKNALSVDIGTCLKFDFITLNREYLGGSIAPGFEMRLNAMHHFTDKLPLPEVVVPSNFIGDSTNDALLSGAYYGMLAEIMQVINFYKVRYTDVVVVATGGDVHYFEKELKNAIFANSFLTLVGLNEILKYNVH